MPYSPPASPINASWAGAIAYGVAGPSITAAWGTTQYLDANGFGGQVFGTPTIALQYLRASPAGADTSAFGSTYVLSPYGYRPPASIANATWVGAPVYGGALSPASVSWSPTSRLISPGGLTTPGMGSPTVFKQQFISATGVAPPGMGTNVYALLYWQYLAPSSPLNATWVGKTAYTAPPLPLNVAFTPPSSVGSVAPVGFDSAAFGAPTAANLSRQIFGVGLAATTYGTPALKWTQFVVPAGVVAAYGTPTVLNFRQYALPGGVAAGVIGSHTVADSHATRTLAASGFTAYALGAPSVSPRFIYAAGIGPINIGTPNVTRNPSPLGIDSLVFGSADIAYRTKILTPAGIAAGVAGQPDVSDRHQDIFVPSLVQQAVFGDAGIKNHWQIVQPEGFDALIALNYNLVENFFKEAKVFGTDVSRYGRPAIANNAEAVLPAGIDSLAFGRASETGVGYPHRTVAIFGADAAAFGSPTLTKTPSFTPTGFDAARYGSALVADRVRTITGSGFEDSAHSSPTVWRRVRGFETRGHDSAVFGSTLVERLHRGVEQLGGSIGAAGQPTVQFRNRTLTVGGIGFNLSDNRQFGTARVGDGTQRTTAIGLAASSFGTLTIARNERLLQPTGITATYGTAEVQLWKRYLGAHGGENDLYGLPTIFNSRQHVSLGEGIGAGTGGTALVVNRNRYIGAVGLDVSRVPAGAEVLNRARLITPTGVVAPFGDALVTYRNRSIGPLGLDAPMPSYWAVVRNMRTILEPSGIGRGRLGVPFVWDNTQTIDCNGGLTLFTSYGTPMVAPRVRSLDVDRFGAAPPLWPEPYVGLYQQHIAPTGPEGVVGQPVLEHHRDIVRLFGADHARYGEPFVRNNTPQLYVGSQEPPTNPQRPWVSFRVRALAPLAFGAASFGVAFVGQRTRYVGAQGINSLRVPLLHRVEFDAPVIPADQRILPDGIYEGTVPNPGMNRRSVYPAGFGATLWGVPFITSTVLYPSSVILVDADQVPAPRVIGPQYITCRTGDEDDLSAPGWEGMPAQYGTPLLNPYYLRISEDINGALAEKEAIVDYYLTNQSDIYDRPFFGNPKVEQRNRTLLHFNRPEDFSPLFGQPTVSLRIRTLLVSGLKSQKFGFPQLPSGGLVTPYWGRDTEDWIEGEDYDTALYGEPTVSRPIVYDPNVRPVGVAPPEFVTATRAELFNRVVAPSGAASAFVAGLPRVHPPEPIVPVGFTGAVGVPGISYFVRSIGPEGFTSFGAEYEPGSFDFGVLAVRRRNRLLAQGPLTSTIPSPIVTMHGLGAVVTLGDQSAFGRPRLGACAC